MDAPDGFGHRVADDPCEIKVGEGDDDAKEPQE